VREDARLDLLVIGGGMAGLAAAAWSARQGLRVALVERAEELGGNARYAAYVWTARSPEAMAEEVPRGDPELGRTVVLGVAEAVGWVRSLGVPCGDPVDMMRFGRGTPVDMQVYVQTCEAVVRGSDKAEVLTSAETRRLLVGGGRVLGAEVRLGDGSVRELRARATLLATGGYQNDRELTAELIHPNAALIPRRTQPNSRGDGLRLGQAAGGVFGKPQAGFYGHLFPYPVEVRDPAEFADATLYYSEHGLLLNQAGERFMDETVGDHLNAQTVLERPGGRALLVADERVRREWILQPYQPGLAAVDRLEEARRRGANLAVAGRLEDLAASVDGWGYDGQGAAETIRHFNATVVRDPGLLDPPRRHDAAPLDEPPYYVVEVWPAITFTLGGLLINPEGRVLDGQGEAVPGLFAAGADSGGTYAYGYAGGLALALVFGLRAARFAAAAAAGRGA
jgi:succinate dehydrogenase/fumarate reductase flavoprotein subunit